MRTALQRLPLRKIDNLVLNKLCGSDFLRSLFLRIFRRKVQNGATMYALKVNFDGLDGYFVRGLGCVTQAGKAVKAEKGRKK